MRHALKSALNRLAPTMLSAKQCAAISETDESHYDTHSKGVSAARKFGPGIVRTEKQNN
jgi:hypothetical protein